MTREPITDAVVRQLSAVLAHPDVSDPHDYVTARVVAIEEGHDELAAFVAAADAATYHEAVKRATDGESDDE